MTDYPNNIPAKLEIIKASEITPKEVRWLWYPYIPFGKVTLLQGDPGDGKSKPAPPPFPLTGGDENGGRKLERCPSGENLRRGSAESRATQ